MDGSSTMLHHWPDVCDRFELLGYMVKHVDLSGMELRFMSKPKERHRSRHVSTLHDLIRRRQINHFGTLEMGHTLSDMLPDIEKISKGKTFGFVRPWFDTTSRQRRQTQYGRLCVRYQCIYLHRRHLGRT